MPGWMEEMFCSLVTLMQLWNLNSWNKSIGLINFLYYFSSIAGREFFVGLSQFTNEAGARAVAAAFPEYPCVPIKVG